MSLDIRVRLVNGTEMKFTCTDEEAREALDAAGPARLGGESVIVINAEDSTFVFPAVAIETIGFANGKVPDWRPPAGTREMMLMAEEPWKTRLKDEGTDLAEQRSKSRRGELVPGFAKVWMRSGQTLFLRYTEIIPALPDRPHAQRRLFGGRPLHAVNDEGGWTVINGANILSVRFFPKQELALESDWKAAAKNGNGAYIRPKGSAAAAATIAPPPARPAVDPQAPTQTMGSEQDKTDKIEKDKLDKELD